MRRLRLRSAERCPAATPLARVCAGALVALAAQCANAPAWAAGAVDAGAPSSSAAAQLPTDVAGWIARVQRAALERSYVGTFVVTTDAGATSGSRIWHACDDTELKMGDYFDLAAQLCGLPRPRRISREEARVQLSPMLLSFMSESRRLDNRRMKRELRVALRYPDVTAGLLA